MKNTFQKRVLEICDRIIESDLLLIMDRLADCTIKLNIESSSGVTCDDVGYFLFEANMIMESIDRCFIREIHVLTELIMALEEWEEDFEFINNSLGLPPES